MRTYGYCEATRRSEKVRQSHSVDAQCWHDHGDKMGMHLKLMRASFTELIVKQNVGEHIIMYKIFSVPQQCIKSVTSSLYTEFGRL